MHSPCPEHVTPLHWAWAAGEPAINRRRRTAALDIGNSLRRSSPRAGLILRRKLPLRVAPVVEADRDRLEAPDFFGVLLDGAIAREPAAERDVVERALGPAILVAIRGLDGGLRFDVRVEIGAVL